MQINRKPLAAAISATILAVTAPNMVLAGAPQLSDLCGATIAVDTTLNCNVFITDVLPTNCTINVADDTLLTLNDCRVDGSGKNLNIFGGSGSMLDMNGNGAIFGAKKIVFEFDGEAPESGCFNDIIAISDYQLQANNVVKIQVNDASCGNISITDFGIASSDIDSKKVIIKALNGSVDISGNSGFNINVTATKSILVDAKGQSFVNGGDLAGRGRLNSVNVNYQADEIDLRSSNSNGSFVGSF